MPLAAQTHTRVPPLYPQPPYRYPGAELYVLHYPVSAEQARAVLPPPFEPLEGDEHQCLLGLGHYPESTLGSYEEIYWLVAARFGETTGLYCAFMYLTSDAGLAAGREIWGWPKKLAVIEWTAPAEHKRHLVVERGGRQLLSARVELTETYPPDAGEPVRPPLPILNLRRTPAAGPEIAPQAAVTETTPEQHATQQAVGLASVRLHGTPEDPVDLLAPPDARVPCTYTRGEIVLPPPARGHRLD